jgi:hypothetical protein
MTTKEIKDRDAFTTMMLMGLVTDLVDAREHFDSIATAIITLAREHGVSVPVLQATS